MVSNLEDTVIFCHQGNWHSYRRQKKLLYCPQVVSSGVAPVVWAVYHRKEKIKSAIGGGVDLLVLGTGRSEGRGNCGWMFCRREEFSNSHQRLGSKVWPFSESHILSVCVVKVWFDCLELLRWGGCIVEALFSCL